MSPPDVSVVMPVWRPRDDWLHAAITSVLAEDGCEIELVVVDDGNERPVDELLRPFQDARARVVRVAHGGQGAALDAGIAAATGRFLRFTDADDIVIRGSTAHLLALTGGRERISYGATVVCDADLTPERTISSTLQGDVVEACLLGRFTTRHVAMLFPRSVVDAAGSWSAGLRVSGDWDFVLRAVEQAPVVGDERPAVLYRRHGESMTGLADVSVGERDRELLIERFLARNPHHRGSGLERAARAALGLDRAAAYAQAGDIRAAVSRLRRVTPLDPVGSARMGAHVAAMALRRLVRAAPRTTSAP